ncbi:hypothetical protein FDG94_gp116 [Pseudomonas phage SM1]|uniref:Uncharacterized protein n=2 Tax=Samunavirus TaxID=2560221 RepID=A0A0U2SAR3_9CAUD|nr:hypothetical protein FDG94_gp116 [Pseudomonas phage SM1]UGC97047.1 hypothetical protein [Pseudomonas phage BHU-1]UGV19999.1 hypothetical protein [Pseudomonas phage Pa BHU-15]UIW13567.1 hypothetical protein [Pseudomonas phage Pa BHU-17]WDS62455.1 hypothetical protein UFRH6_25 [Pseudomonas phage UF_RH6]ALT58108.1 hypothetical protein SM1_0116 [Pseudomonas phage SM1]
MDQIDRNTLGDAVAAFLANGGSVEQCPPVEPSSRKPKTTRRSKSPRASGLPETHPFDVPLSLGERTHASAVKRCVEQGYSLTQAVKHLGLPRDVVLRICREYQFRLRGPRPESETQAIQALAERYAIGDCHAVACRKLGLDQGVYQTAYARYRAADPSLPEPPSASSYSEAQILSMLLLGLRQGRKLIEIIDDNGLNTAEAMRIYDRHRRARRRLL